MWSTEDVRTYEEYSTVIPIASFQDSKDDGNADHRNRSLSLLREAMARDATNILAIGGRLHSGTIVKPGVTEELQIAERLDLPSFVLAGFRGEAEVRGEKYFKNRFLSENEKKNILNSTSIAFLPSTLVALLERDRHKISFYHLLNKLLKTRNY